MSKYLELFAKAIGMGNTVPPLPSPKERSVNELDTEEERMARTAEQKLERNRRKIEAGKHTCRKVS